LSLQAAGPETFGYTLEYYVESFWYRFNSVHFKSRISWGHNL